jgi:O-antigen ligase
MQDAKMHSGVALFSGFLAFLIPVIAGAYWPIYSVSPEGASLLLRPIIVGISLLLALLWFNAPLSSAEVHAACVLCAVAAGLLIPSVAATDPARSLAVWLKLVILCTVALLLSRGLRHEGTAKFLGAGLIVAAVLVGLFTLFTYVRFIGFVVPTYKLTREFKGIAERTGIPLNAVPFTCVFSFLVGMSLLRANWLLWLLGSGLFVISSIFTGSRTPLALLLLSALVLALLNGFQSRRLPIRLIAYAITAIVPIAILAVVLQQPFRRMSSITEGRWDLWYVAIRKFAERPILGSGYDSWRDDLASMLPGAYPLTRYMAKNIVGGYHNEYLALLAEQGLIGFLAGIVLVCFLSFLSWKAAFRRWNMRHNGQWILFACIFLLLRAALEIPGLFGDGSEPADFLAYVFLAIVISRFSREEDFLRANTPSSFTNENTESSSSARRAQGRHVPVGLGRSYV